MQLATNAYRIQEKKCYLELCHFHACTQRNDCQGKVTDSESFRICNIFAICCSRSVTLVQRINTIKKNPPTVEKYTLFCKCRSVFFFCIKKQVIRISTLKNYVPIMIFESLPNVSVKALKVT